MPIGTPVLLTSGGSDTDALDYTTASITPTAGTSVLAAIFVYDAGGPLWALPAVTGCGLTWTQVATTGSTASGPIRIRVFRASALNPSTEAVTFAGVVDAAETADGAAWMIVEIPGTDLTTTDGVIQFDTHAVAADNWTDGGLVLGEFRDAQSGTCFFQAAHDSAGGTLNNTAGAGFTELAEVDQTAGGDSLCLSFMYAFDNQTQAVGTVSAANDALLGIMMEIGITRRRVMFPRPYVPLHRAGSY